jgi:hypothetical protein
MPSFDGYVLLAESQTVAVASVRHTNFLLPTNGVEAGVGSGTDQRNVRRVRDVHLFPFGLRPCGLRMNSSE